MKKTTFFFRHLIFLLFVSASYAQPPIIAIGNSNADYLEGTPIFIAPDITISNPGDVILESATITLSSPNTGDILSFTGNSQTGDIAGSYNSSTGELSLLSSGGSASEVQWEEALHAVLFDNTTDNPSADDRILGIKVNSGEFQSNSVAVGISVTPVNDPPVLSTTITTIDYYENSGPLFINPSITLSDPDSFMTEAHVDSDMFESYEGTTLISNPATMGDVYGEGYIDEGWFDVFSASNTATISEWQAALQAVTYTNTSDDLSPISRFYTYTIIDDQGEYSNTVVVMINMIPINDAPIKTSGSVDPLTINEDTTSASLGLTAVDYDAIEASQTFTYTIVQAPLASFGSVTLDDGVTVVNPGSSYTLSEIRGMRFQPAPNIHGVNTFSYVANDGGGTANGGIDSVVETIAITVNSITDIPVITGNYCAGTITVSGTSVELDGTLIKVYSGSSQIGTAAVASGSWTATVPPLSLNDIITATATVGADESAASPSVTVLDQVLWYLDADGDDYYSGAPVAACDSPGAGYATSGLIAGGDCVDSNALVNPGQTEICYNNIDDNCNLTLSEGCAPVVVNITPSYDTTTLTSLSQAIPAVSYSYGGFTNLKYRFTITNTTTGAVSSDIIQTSRYVTIPAALHSYPGAYDIKVSAVINEEIVDFAGNTVRVNAPALQLVTLSTANCGATLATLASTLTANPAPNATGYTFRIRLNDANPTPTYAYSQSATRFIGANTFTTFPLQYASSYKVSVSYSYTDPITSLTVESPYGAECTVNTPSIPLISMASPTCGTSVTAMNANISAQAASYATGYRFRIRLFSDNGPTPNYFYSLPNASRFSSLTAFQGITLAYSTEYSISVEYSIFDGTNTVWSGFGADCKVTTPFFPTTGLVPSQCGLTIPTPLNQQLNITPYPGFPNYKVKLDEVNGEDVVNSQELIFTYSYFRLNQFSIAQNGKNYNVSVAIKQNGVFGDYSTACDLHSGEITAGDLQKAKPEFKATAYPNPFANNFMLNVKSESESNVSIKVYDMLGRVIEQRDVRVFDMQSTTIGNNYPSGVYNVVVSQEDSVQTLRVVKR